MLSPKKGNTTSMIIDENRERMGSILSKKELYAMETALEAAAYAITLEKYTTVEQCLRALEILRADIKNLREERYGE